MNLIAEKNRNSWNDSAAQYNAKEHDDATIHRILENPASAFHKTTWELILAAFPSLDGKRVCVPSSGDNHAVFAFARLGAHVTSCDISEKQLLNAETVAKRRGLDIDFIQADTMTLENVPSDTYDFVYTSNGVHVWINDLSGMYHSIHRVMKSGAVYIMYEIHPFHRPFDGKNLKQLTVIKPYSNTGPFESETEVTFGWRIQDIVNAMLDAGLMLRHVEEMHAEINYEDPDWIPLSQKLLEYERVYDKLEVEQMYDWRSNPMAALPHWLSMVATK
ncbi:MAG: class I SAM-dependent methyltransferase [Clostridiaceae bacterium]